MRIFSIIFLLIMFGLIVLVPIATWSKEVCIYNKEITTRDNEKLGSSVTMECWTDKPPIKKFVPLTDIIPDVGQVILISKDCMSGEQITKVYNDYEPIKGVKCD